MHHRFFSHGLRSPFERTPYRLIAYLIDHVEFDEPLGEHPHRPVSLAFGNVGASQRHKESFLASVEFAGRSRPRPLGERGLQPLLDEAFPYSLDGGHGGAQERGYLLVDATFVGQKQYPSSAYFASAASPFGGQLLQLVPLALIEIHYVLLHGYLLSGPPGKENTLFIHSGDVLVVDL
jgi:hypothetical protein